jgi:CHAT domain-containing protein/Tfp pilus assembly protein PilF
LHAHDRPATAIACGRPTVIAGHQPSAAERAQLQLQSAVSLEEAGKYREALSRLRAASAVAAQAHLQRERTAISAELGWVEYRLGDLEKAEHQLTEAISTEAFASQLERATALDRLGVVQRERSSYPKAEESFTHALALAKTDSSPPSGRMQAQIYNDRGGLRTYQSDFRSAVEDLQRALELYRGLNMAQSADAAKTLNNLGNAHRELGDMVRARSELEQALELKTRLLGPEHPSTASTINNLGMVAEQTHDRAGAVAYYRRALLIYEKTLGKTHANVASVAVQLGRLQSGTGDYAAALGLLERARAIRERVFGVYSNWTAETLVDLVPLYTKLGQATPARRGAERAVAIAVTSGEQELLYDCYMSYARTLAAQGQRSAAILFGKRAINIVQQMREHDVPLSKREQRSFLSQRESVYRDLGDWLIAAGRLPEAEQVLDLLKTEELADYAQLSLPPAEAERVGMVHREASAGRALDDAIDALSRQLGQPNAEHTPQVAALRARFLERLQGVVAMLTDHAQQGASGKPREDTLSLKAPYTAVIRYLVLPEQVRILMRTPRGQLLRSVAVNRADLDRQVLELHHRMQSGLGSEHESQSVFRLVIGPIAAELAAADVRHLIVVADDVLRYVPFAALHDGRGYLIESYDVSLATPAAPRGEAAAAQPLRAAAFGVSQTPDGRTLLPNVPIELHRVVRSSPEDHFGVLPGVILLDRAFTRDNAARALAGGYPVVHIASHFVLRPGSLADSYLLLGDGTHLTLEALKNDALPLRGVEVLTLSACDTAVGEVDADGREIESFAALAQRRGARSVLAALWAVPDLSTSVLMGRYYSSLAHGDSSGEALREAQLLLLRGPAGGATEARFSHVHSPYADPFFWAAFELLGSPTGRRLQ